MPPRLNLFGASRSLVIRSRPSIAARPPRILPAASRRYFADKTVPSPPATSPNQDVLGSVSEEAAELGEVTGETKPDLDQGTPVQEVCSMAQGLVALAWNPSLDQHLLTTILLQVLERDEEGRENAPQVIKDQFERDQSTSKNAKDSSADTAKFENLIALGQLQNISEGGYGTDPVDPDEVGHKFGIPELPLPSDGNLHNRYHPVVDQVTNLIMKDGKLSVAQRVGSSVPLFS